MEYDMQKQALEPPERSSSGTGAHRHLMISIGRASGDLARRILGTIPPPIRERIEGKSQSSSPRGARHPSGYLLSLILLVVLPSIASIIYLAFVASDQFVAETRFAVRGAQLDFGREKVLSALSSLGSSSISSVVGQEPYVVTSYIRSRAIVDDVSKNLDVREIFSRPEADFWAKLPRTASTERLVTYWTRMVTTYIDAPSGIVTVYTRAFRPDDALALAREVIRTSEKLVNDVSARARNDAMHRAEEELRRYEAAVRQALLDLRKYRDAEGFIDPVSVATSTSQLLTQAMSEEIQIQNDLFVASRAMSPDAPTLQTLKARLESVDKQIEQLKSKMTGDSLEGRTVAAALVKFEQLELKRIFAERLYAMAQDALERARLRAEQQNLYLTVFVPPSLPQDAQYPQRLGYSIIIPLGLTVLWGILALTAAAVEDHRL
jgi:capsular polysaccharide transport system permease protein